MASKSKRRRRVLRASCILAALIIAGSSFAWFTSKDEVTNRLTANADYNVVAIENFVPPKQFVPGQTVTKEEAVTNTGNVDAFVKQKITADAKVSVEVPTTIAPDVATDASDYLKLERQIDWGSLEAGSVLAWAPYGSAYKGQIIDFGIDGTTDTNHDFNPDVTGLYIFRRALVKDGNNNVTSYEYVGYYFVKAGDSVDTSVTEDTYYKIYSLNVPQSALDTETDGLLKAAPTVSYSKKIVTSAEKVDMYYLAPGDEDDGGEAITDYRLKFVFNGQNVVDGAVASAVSTDYPTIYANYQKYLDYLQGKTTYVPDAGWTQPTTPVVGTDDLRGLDQDNATGLIDKDIYDQDDPSASADGLAKSDLTNLSYRRLEDLKYGKDSTGASSGEDYGIVGLFNEASPDPADYADASTVEEAWAEAYKAAKTSRQTINTGINASNDLKVYKTAVEGLIGRAAFSATNSETGSGLRLIRTDGDGTTDAVGTNKWAADRLYDPTDGTIDPYAIPDVQFNIGNDTDHINFKTTSNGLNMSTDTYVMTADNVTEARFADVGENGTFGSASNPGSQVKFIDPTAPFTGSGSLSAKWSKYVQNQKRMNLIDKKIALVEAAIGSGEGVIDPAYSTETNVVRTLDEGYAILNVLKAERATIKVDYDAAQEAYETEVANLVTMLKKMNTLQGLVDTANKEYNTYLLDNTDHATYTYDPEADSVTDNEAKDTIVVNVITGDKTNYGEADSPVEDTLEKHLNDTYGIAHKDADTTGYVAQYNCDHESVTPDHDRDPEFTTYSRTVTQGDIDACVSANTEFKNTPATDGDGKIALTTSATSKVKAAEADSVKSHPYYRLLQVDDMMKFRENQYKYYYNEFKEASDAAALNKTESEQDTEPVVVYIGLGKIDTGANDPAWQYVGDADKDNADNEFEFGYTRVLPAGATSEKLIEYVKFADEVTQNSFIDLVFDINVGVESAQVVYNGDRVGAQAAQASLRTIIPTEEEYANSDARVEWEATAAAADPAITDKDPNPKAEPAADPTAPAPAAAKEYTLGGKDVTSMTSDIIAKSVVDGTSGETVALTWKAVTEDDTYYGTGNTAGAKFYKDNAGTLDTTAVDLTEKAETP